MTMVIDSQSRHYGNIGYPANAYSSHLTSSPHFTDPWGSQADAQPPAHAYATPVPKHDVPRSMPLSYPQIPVSTQSMATGSAYPSAGFGGSDLLNLSHDIPRSNYASEQIYQSSPQTSSSYTSSSYSPLNYTQSLQQHQQHQHQQHQQSHDLRKITDPYASMPSRPESFPGYADFPRLGMSRIPGQNLPVSVSLTPLAACWL